MGKGQTNGGMNSLLGQGSSYKGTAQVEGTLRVDGTYDGDVVVGEMLVVGKSGFFTGQVHARDVVVSGRLSGTINATQSVELQRGCHFEGDVHTRTLIVEEGVFFEGYCHMEEDAVETPVRALSAQVDGGNGAPVAKKEFQLLKH